MLKHYSREKEMMASAKYTSTPEALCPMQKESSTHPRWISLIIISPIFNTTYYKVEVKIKSYVTT